MATDIAFVVGVMALLGRHVPFGLKIMLLSLAIADDIGAVVVIAAFYSTNLNGWMLGLVAAGLALAGVLRNLGVRSVPVYVIVGAGVWLACRESGIHPAVAGVALGLLTPTGTWVRRASLRLALADLLADLRDDGEDDVGARDLQLLSFAARESAAPLDRLESALHPWVGFGIMPLFALANAGVEVRPAAVADPIAVAVALGLFVGKPAGVVLFSWLAVRFGIARLPSGVNWVVLLGGGFLAGIGFTMSLFVANLAFPGREGFLADAKVGILAASLFSAIGGGLVLATGGKAAPDDRSAR
jgi:NhaA family Na+:H+ antiporter